jgi:hypothetical protein
MLSEQNDEHLARNRKQLGWKLALIYTLLVLLFVTLIMFL